MALLNLREGIFDESDLYYQKEMKPMKVLVMRKDELFLRQKMY